MLLVIYFSTGLISFHNLDGMRTSKSTTRLHVLYTCVYAAYMHVQSLNFQHNFTRTPQFIHLQVKLMRIFSDLWGSHLTFCIQQEHADTYSYSASAIVETNRNIKKFDWLNKTKTTLQNHCFFFKLRLLFYYYNSTKFNQVGVRF